MDTDTLEIVIVAGGMPFGPRTLEYKSLGGSETAVIGVAHELRKRGHIVTVFCPLPEQGEPDYHPNGAQSEDGVRYVHIEQYQQFVAATEVDLLVLSRSPELANCPHQARKCVLWMHDLATFHGPAQGIQNVAWNVDEVWCVSEWHRQQYHKVTGYPLSHIKATRNGVIKYDVMPFGKIDKQLVYAARPERGLEALVRPGGIMSRLPDYNLKITMYDNFPPQMQAYYKQLFYWAQALPNVDMLPPSTQPQLRSLIESSQAYVYPTDFEETSCMLARECMEQLTPFITVKKGALPETLGDCGLFVSTPPGCEYGSDDWCQWFAQGLRTYLEDEATVKKVVDRMAARTDLHWDGVAEQWEQWARPEDVGFYSKVWSLLEDSDVIPAIAYADYLIESDLANDGVRRLRDQMEALYPYLFGRETLASYYERYFVREDSKGARQRAQSSGMPRFEAIAEHIARLEPGSHVLDYGCAEGVIILELAQRNPDKFFHGVDHAATNIDLCRRYAAEMGLSNVTFGVATEPSEVPLSATETQRAARSIHFDAVICSEVLEHVPEPWQLIHDLEVQVKVGGRVIITVPQGPWEAIGLYDKEQFPWRAHIWHINKWMVRNMFGNKEGCEMQSLFNGHQVDGRMLGHLVFAYTADHTPVHPVDPLQKAANARLRNTVGAAMIVKNGAESILKTLNSFGKQVQQVSIAVSQDTTDDTVGIIQRWALERPWMDVRIQAVPAIKAGEYGFDDARNASIDELNTDWFLWIDSDEYLSGDFTRFIRNNAFDSYSIHQHHFSCDPRGAPAQIDKPARLCRFNRGFRFIGKVHEHAELGHNKGPGFTWLLPEVDIGHTGYVNENVRRHRFDRNFPLLIWDREVNPDRNLGKYLWLRDIIHRMRYAFEQGDQGGARRTAEEAVEFYRHYGDQWDELGMGGINAYQYYSEALAVLGRGLPIGIQVQLNNESFQIGGICDDPEEIITMIRKALNGKMEQLKSGYWQ